MLARLRHLGADGRASDRARQRPPPDRPRSTRRAAAECRAWRAAAPPHIAPSTRGGRVCPCGVPPHPPPPVHHGGRPRRRAAPSRRRRPAGRPRAVRRGLVGAPAGGWFPPAEATVAPGPASPGAVTAAMAAMPRWWVRRPTKRAAGRRSTRSCRVRCWRSGGAP